MELKPFATQAAALLKVMGNPHRLMVLCHLADGELSVGQLESRIGLSQSALSQHLAKLRRDRLVKTRRNRQTIYYALNGREARTLMTTLGELYGSRRALGQVPEATEEAAAA
jgi:DNA-binding transcriptional ArsR family regulator